MIDTTPVSCHSLGKYFHVNGKHLEEHYVRHLSDFLTWDQLDHAEDWVLFPYNTGENLSIDETSLSQGELIPLLPIRMPRAKWSIGSHGKRRGEPTCRLSAKKEVPQGKRGKVKEVTLDMASTMQKIVRQRFPNAEQVADRFHVQQLVYEAVQDLRIHHRWKAIEQENAEMELCKELDQEYKPNILENGDTLRQLLARSRNLLFKQENKWTLSQYQRAEILFKLFPDIKLANELCRELSSIYGSTKDKEVAFTRLARWYEKVERAGFKTFNTVSRTVQNNSLTILNYFNNRSTNASAESFNAKIKAFRSQFRGVANIPFFLFRLANIYA